MLAVWILFFLAIVLTLNFNCASLAVSAVAYLGYLLLFAVFSPFSLAAVITLSVIGCLCFLPLLVSPIRRQLLSRPILAIYRRMMPRLSNTEKEALEAGDVGFEKELFSGMPNWFNLQKMRTVTLSDEEQAFIDGPVNQLCSLIDDWEISHRSFEISEVIWQYLKRNGFFGLIIPKHYGGKEFSALAHSQILTKVASVSASVATALGVPNSLGPGELLLKYGSDEQKDYYLPRLARGEEVPCFALTSPQAGSDAGAIEDHGVIVRRSVNGVEKIGILLNWDKRYITLAPIATLLGLAFKLYDPDHIIGKKADLGITCALIPVTTAGVTTGRRHYPLCATFPNGSTQGKDVFIPLDSIIGGQKMIGAGWRMLMECLAIGRAISLPSTAMGAVKRVVYVSGAYAKIRRQFNVSIGHFGGIQEALARIGGNAYRSEALRLLSVGNIDRGVASSVASAITKCHITESARKIINDAMDIHGGKGICMGANNYLAQSYIEMPIGITVEGANILTRSLIIFGQGAMRCHPFVYQEIKAAEKNQLKDFDAAFFAHIGMIASNKVRSIILGLTSSRFAMVPKGELKRYYQHFSRFSAAFAWLTDISMIALGSELKRNECLSARLGDMLSFLYMGAAVMRYYEERENRQALPLVEWVCQDLLYQLQKTAHEFLLNFPFRWLAKTLRMIVFPLGQHFNPPSDSLGKKVAALLMEVGKTREELADLVYTGQAPTINPLINVQRALIATLKVERLLKRLVKAEKDQLISGMTFELKVNSAVKNTVLTSDEADQLLKANALCRSVIDVDDFPWDYFKERARSLTKG